MTVVAFLPTFETKHPMATQQTLKSAPFILEPPHNPDQWVSHVATQLAHTAEPLALVFFGASSVHAPAIGFSRRALRRPVMHYILVNPVMPTIGGDYGDWPDAPVTLVLTPDADNDAKDAALQARLRGWIVTQEPLDSVCQNY